LKIAAVEIARTSQIPVGRARGTSTRSPQRGFLVWGFVNEEFICFPLSVSLFDQRARFFVPTRTLLTPARGGAVKVGRRTNLPACSAFARPHLDSSEHDGTLGAVGMTIRGEPAFGRGSIAPQPCIRWVKNPNHDAAMRIGSEAPRKRTHSPFRHESQGNTSGPATSNHHRRPVTSGPTAPNYCVTSASSVHCAGRRTMPSGTTPS
jgi:hypothetical protein